MAFEVDPNVQRRLRRMALDGKSVSALMRYLVSELGLVTPIEVAWYFKETFKLDFDDAHCICGWWHDGTLELSDARIDEILGPKIETTKLQWSQDVD